VWGGGVQLGVDYRVSDNFVAGFGFGWNRQNSEFDRVRAVNGSGAGIGGGEIESDGYSPSVYGSFFSGPFHADGMLSYTYLDYEVRPARHAARHRHRQSTPPRTATRTPTSSARTSWWAIDFPIGGLSIGPLSGVDFRQTWIDGYSESGVPASR
jgi:outer membrane autotransporter protein